MEKEELLKLIKEEFYRIKPQWCSDFFYNRDKRIPCLPSLQKMFDGATYNEILMLAGVQEDDLNFVRRDKDKCLDRLRKIIEKLGYIPNPYKFNKMGCSLSIIVKYFGSWENAVREAGYKEYECKELAEVKENNAELLQMYIEYSNNIGRPATIRELDDSDEIYNAGVFSIRFGGMNELRKLAGFEIYDRSPRKYTKESISNVLIDKIIKNNRLLTVKQIDEDSDLPALATILKYFKTTKISEVNKEILQVINERNCNLKLA